MDATEDKALVSRKQIINRLESLSLVVDYEVKERILSSIPKDILDAVYQAKKDDWLPVKLYTDINDCISAEIGEEGSYNLSLKSFDKMIASSMIGRMLQSTLCLLKIKPSTVSKLCSQFWKSIYRNGGDMSFVEMGPNQSRIILDKLPQYLANNRNSLMGFAGGIHAALSLSGYKANVVIEKQDVEKGEVTFIASWSPNSAPDKAIKSN